MPPCRFLALATLAVLACLVSLPARAVPTGATYAFYSVNSIKQVEDNRSGVGETSQIHYDDFGAQASAFASNSVPFPGTPPALRASASLLLDGSQEDLSYQSWAAAEGNYDWYVADVLNPSATGTTLIQGIITLSGTLVGNPSAPSSSVSVDFSFRDPVQGGAAQQIGCSLTATAGGAECASTTSGSAPADLSGLSITQLSANEWQILGPVIFEIEVAVNEVNQLGGQLTTSVGAGLGTSFSAESLFDQTLTLEYESAEPGIQITLIPEPATVALLGLGMIGLASAGRRRDPR